MIAVGVVLVAIAVIQAVALPSQKPGPASTLDELMRRAHAYVAVYEDHQLSALIARETYVQQVLTADDTVVEKRILISDYMLFQLPPREEWFALRDVHEVDGAPVTDREVRREMLFTAPRERPEQLAMAIDQESARFNIGKVPRTVNLPTFALRFLRPANRKRFDFKKEAVERVGDAVTWVVGYRETDKPTFSATARGQDVPASGRFWIDPDSGAVLKTEMILGGTRRLRNRASVTVTYAANPVLGFRVPVEMQERYDNPRSKRDEVIVSTATYADFRPFDWRSLKRPGTGSR